MPGIAHAQGARKQTVINGRRIKTIDIHAHCVIPEAMALHGDKMRGQTRGQAQQVIVIEERLGAMDEQGIDIEALSINPFWYRLERDLAAKSSSCRTRNWPNCARAHPDRFVGLASLALQYPDLAVQQLENAVKKYSMRGAAIGGSVAGEEFSDAKFHPVWAKAEELGVRAVHPPAEHARTGQALQGQRLAVERHRQSARHHDRAVAPDLRRHARQISAA